MKRKQNTAFAHDAQACAGDWKDDVRKSVVSGAPIRAFKSSARVRQADRLFGMKMPRAWLARAALDDPRDPLLRQVLPDADETLDAPGFTADPVGEFKVSRAGLVRKYRDRVLLVLTGACAIHCRYCFRRHFPYGEHATRGQIGRAVRYIAEHPEISEVILSGGDPLMLDNRRLFEVWSRLEAVGHVRRIRLHTRMPAVVPSRVDDELAAWLNARSRRCVVVLHINHANEIGDDVVAALDKLRAPLFNQSVLLKGVNDDIESLCALSVACFEAGVIPYYLHLLDRVSGAAHFEVDDERAVQLHAAMRERLPGYLVPRLVRESPEILRKELLVGSAAPREV